MRMIPEQVKAFFFETLTRISPVLNTRVHFYRKFGRKLDIVTPHTLNEKILKLKFEGNNPLVKKCADKYTVREYVAEVGCAELLVPLIDVYDSVDEIRWEELPDKFAMKWNFGCGYNIICSNKAEFNEREMLRKMKMWERKKNYYLLYSEMQYKDVDKKIIVEKYLDNGTSKLPEDYKFYCMNGVCRTVMVCKEREIGRRAKYFWLDRQWKLLPYSKEAIENPEEDIPKPACLEKAIEYAEKLAKNFKFVRVDLYIIGDNVFFGELTFTPAGGMDVDLLLKPPGSTKTVDEILGAYLQI